MNRINFGPGLGRVIRFVGLNYDHASAEDSWQRILAFFETHLAAPR
jgi:dienelactone hydrolase